MTPEPRLLYLADRKEAIECRVTNTSIAKPLAGTTPEGIPRQVAELTKAEWQAALATLYAGKWRKPHDSLAN